MNFLEPKYPCNNRISVADTSHWRRMRDFEPDWIQEKLLLFLPEDLVLFNCVYTNDGNANPIFISSILSTWSLCTGFNAKVTDDVGGGIEKFISVTNICRQNQRWHEHRSAIIILLETHHKREHLKYLKVPPCVTLFCLGPYVAVFYLGT